MTNLTTYLDTILNWIEINNPQAFSLFQSPLTVEEIDNILTANEYKLPQEVYSLYKWRNGVDPYHPDFFKAFCTMDFPSLEQMVKEYLRNVERNFWHPSYFPMFIDYDSTLFVKGGIKQETSSPIFYLDRNIPIIVFDSLTSQMKTIAECCNLGVFHWETRYGKTLLTRNGELFRQVVLENNQLFGQPLQVS